MSKMVNLQHHFSKIYIDDEGTNHRNLDPAIYQINKKLNDPDQILWSQDISLYAVISPGYIQFQTQLHYILMKGLEVSLSSTA